jgi:hypothetical protein
MPSYEVSNITPIESGVLNGVLDVKFCVRLRMNTSLLTFSISIKGAQAYLFDYYGKTYFWSASNLAVYTSNRYRKIKKSPRFFKPVLIVEGTFILRCLPMRVTR